MIGRRRVVRSRRGGVELRIPAEERALLASLLGEIGHLLDGVPEGASAVDPLLARLFPVAYARDADAERSYEEVVRAELAGHHREVLAVLARTSEATHLSDADADAWLGALNDLRLVLGTALEVTEQPRDVAPDDPELGRWVSYTYLSYLQGELVEAMSGSLPPPAPGADEGVPDDPWGEPPGGLRWDGTDRPGVT
ncbi:MAG: DUF2017 family protein [Actinomycetota bacterium]|nr:DUF2017 family protein [Actinomycetota bacterium]